MAHQTNEQKLRKLIFKELDTVEVALLTERILCIADLTLQSIEQEPERWTPEKIPVFSKEVYIKLCRKIKQHLEPEL